MADVKLKSNVRSIIAQLERGAADAVDDSMKGVAQHLSDEFHAPKSGHIYGSHQASAPGEPPAIDTTELITSIEYAKPTPTRGTITVGAAHGVHLEFGTTRMAPRPFFSTAFEAERPAFVKRCQQLFDSLK